MSILRDWLRAWLWGSALATVTVPPGGYLLITLQCDLPDYEFVRVQDILRNKFTEDGHGARILIARAGEVAFTALSFEEAANA